MKKKISNKIPFFIGIVGNLLIIEKTESILNFHNNLINRKN